MQHALARAPDQPEDDDEFAEMLTTEAVRLRRFAVRLTGAGADADDLLQDTLLRCWAGRRGFQPGSNFISWARTVMRNAFLTGVRRTRHQADLPDGAVERMLSVAATQGEAVELRDVDWAMSELSPEHREAVQLAAQGLTIEEAAARLSISEGTFKSRVWRGRARLRSLTEDRAAHPTTTMVATPQPTTPKRRSRRNWKGVMIG